MGMESLIAARQKLTALPALEPDERAGIDGVDQAAVFFLRRTGGTNPVDSARTD